MKTSFVVISWITIILFGFLGAVSAFAGNNTPAITVSQSSSGVAPDLVQKAIRTPLKMVSPGVFEIGNCKIDKNENRVEFPAMVNMQKGLLEYIVVGTAGKLHESLLVTEVEPYDLQIALLLTGLEGTLRPLVKQGDVRLPEGDPVTIKVSWTEKGKKQTQHVEKWLLQNKKPVANVPWTFTGSMIINGTFLAQSERSIVAVFHDPVAMIDHRLLEGSNDKIWFANHSVVPSQGTKVTVAIQKAGK